MKNGWALIATACDADAERLFRGLRNVGFRQIVRTRDRQETIDILISVLSKPAVALISLDEPDSSFEGAVPFAASVCPCVVVSPPRKPLDGEIDFPIEYVEFTGEPVSLERLRLAVEAVLERSVLLKKGEASSTHPAEVR